MEAGEVIRVISAGGGGWGDPLKRDEELVARDVEFGYVTMSGAKKDYGVVVRRNFTADHEATKRLRAKLRSRK